MQNYINPIELLNLNTDIPTGVDGLTIRKAKKTLLAEIELSDTDTIIHNGIELTKSDCLRAIDDLDHKDKRDFHLFIYDNADLNHFLTSGDLNFFRTFKTESIYKLQINFPAVIVIGNESNGIRKEILELQGQQISIPGYGKAESLNASVATGIILSNITNVV